MQRASPPLLLPSQTRRLPTSSPGLVPPRWPDPLKVKFALVTFEKTIEFPELPQATAVTLTFEPDRAAVAVEAMSAFTAVTTLFAALVVLVPTETSPMPLRVATHVNVCVPITNCWPIMPAPETEIGRASCRERV